MMGIFPTGSERERAIFRSALRRVNAGDSGEERLNVEMEFEEVETL